MELKEIGALPNSPYTTLDYNSLLLSRYLIIVVPFKGGDAVYKQMEGVNLNSSRIFYSFGSGTSQHV